MSKDTVKNIDLFNLYTAKIFETLYEYFPLAQDIDSCKMINKEINPMNLNIPKECEIFEHTMYWLNQNDYITYKAGDINGFLAVVLTSKGLTLLKSAPSSLQQDTSIIEAIKHWSKKGADQMIKKTIDIAIAYAVKIF